MKSYLLGLYEKACLEEWSWPVKMEHAGKAGFDFIEMSVDETDQKQARLDWSKQERREFVSTAGAGLPVTSICLSANRKYPIGSHYKETRDKGMDIIYKAVDLAYDLGIRIVQLAGYDVFYNEESDEETRKYFTDNLRKASGAAASCGVMLGLETMENDFMNTVAKAMDFVRAVDSPYLGVYPDVGNVSNGTPFVAEDLLRGKGHIFSAHLKETKEGVYRNLMYGEGSVDFDLVAEVFLGMDVRRFNAEFWHLPGRDADEDMVYACKKLRGILDRTEEKIKGEQ